MTESPEIAIEYDPKDPGWTKEARERMRRTHTGREVTPGKFRAFCACCRVSLLTAFPVSPTVKRLCDECAEPAQYRPSGNHGIRAGVHVEDSDANGGWSNVVSALEA